MEAHTNHGGTDLVRGYRAASYLSVGFAGAAIVLSLLFVRIQKDEREGWTEKDGVGVEVSGASTPSGIVVPEEVPKDEESLS